MWQLSLFNIFLLLCNGFLVLIICLCVSESGGGTFCAVAALHLMGFLQEDLASNLRDSASIDIRMLLEWCLQVKLGLNHISAIICQKLPSYLIYSNIRYFLSTMCKYALFNPWWRKKLKTSNGKESDERLIAFTTVEPYKVIVLLLCRDK